MNVLNPTEATHFDSVFINVFAAKNSSQAIRKEKIEVATIPGRIKGRWIRKKSPNLVQPSTSAASSSSLGKVSKKPQSSHTHNGRATATSAIISPTNESNILNVLNKIYIGMRISGAGSICVVKIKNDIGLRPPKRNREKE
jgi:hypothetical protein